MGVEDVEVTGRVLTFGDAVPVTQAEGQMCANSRLFERFCAAAMGDVFDAALSVGYDFEAWSDEHGQASRVEVGRLRESVAVRGEIVRVVGLGDAATFESAREVAHPLSELLFDLGRVPRHQRRAQRMVLDFLECDDVAEWGHRGDGVCDAPQVGPCRDEAARAVPEVAHVVGHQPERPHGCPW